MTQQGLQTEFAFTLPCGYVDERGVAHFAAEKLDARYQLFFKGGQSFDTADGLPEKTARPVMVPTAPPRLLAFFEISSATGQGIDELKFAMAERVLAPVEKA